MKRITRILILSLLLVCLLAVTATAEEMQVVTEEIQPFTSHLYEEQEIALQDTAEELREQLYEGLWTGETSINISKFSLKYTQSDGCPELKAAMTWLKDHCPELFHVEWSYQSSRIGNTVTAVHPQYNMTGEELTAARTLYQAELDHILATMDSSWSDVETVLYINGYLASHYEYDLSLAINDAYTFLKTGKGVCQSYYLTCKALLDACGIPSTYGKSENANHIWNVVQAGGNWYHLDVTWNDPTQDHLGRAGHTYALLSSTALHAQDQKSTVPHDRTDWVCGRTVSCSDTTYDNAYWRDVTAPYVEIGGKWYYSSLDGICVTFDIKKTGSVLIPHSKWGVIGMPGYTWTSPYSGLGAFENWLVYNTSDAVKAYNPFTKETRVFYTTPNDKKDIYGIAVTGNQVVCLLDDCPNVCLSAEYETVILTGLDGSQSKKYGGITVSEKDGLVTVLGTNKTAQPFFIVAAGYAADGKQTQVKLISTADLPKDGLQWQMTGASVKLFLLSNKYAPLD